MWDYTKLLFYVFFPRFMTEETAFVLTEEGVYVPLCALFDVGEDEYHAVGDVKFFNFFGLALFPKLVGELRLAR